MEDEKETASNLIAEISWSSKCAKEQVDMLGYTGYQKEYHIRKTIAESLARIGYRKVGEVHEPIIEKEVVNYIFNGYKEAQYSIKATCPICNGILAGGAFPDTSQEKRDFKEKAILGKIPNYCPNCGARLKEVKE